MKLTNDMKQEDIKKAAGEYAADMPDGGYYDYRRLKGYAEDAFIDGAKRTLKGASAAVYDESERAVFSCGTSSDSI